MREAWPALDHVFSIRTKLDPHSTDIDTNGVKILPGPRVRKNTLNENPIDLLVVERGYIRKPRPRPVPEEWETLVEATSEETCPRLVLESWPAHAITWEQGPSGKAARIRWIALGYETRVRRVLATEVGGSISQSRLLVARVRSGYAARWTWGAIRRGLDARPMSNLLIPDGLWRKLPPRRNKFTK